VARIDWQLILDEVLHGVVKRARVRFELENHAHDIYDAFGGIHSAAVRKQTYFTLAELHGIIKAAHEVSGPEAIGAHGAVDASRTKKTQPKNPLMGRDVQVTNLWEVRDFWQWLMPGHGVAGKSGQLAPTMAAFVSYENLQSYRDFVIALEPSSADPEDYVSGGQAGQDVRVGLWAKQFMSDPDDKLKFVGTLCTSRMYAAVAADSVPKVAVLTSSVGKVAKEGLRLKLARKLSTGKYCGQFSPARMADCIAMLSHDWAHFAEPSVFEGISDLPHELAKRLRRSGCRGAHGALAAPGVEDPHAAVPFLDLQIGVDAPPLRQVAHALSSTCAVERATDVPLVHKGSRGPKNIEEFKASPIVAGCMVLTRAARHCALARQCPDVARLAYWPWRILRVVREGSTLPANSRHLQRAAETTYEAHLYCPGGGHMGGTLHPLWDEQSEMVFLATVEEKRGQRHKKKDVDNYQPVVHVPIRGFLRPENIVGGGFQLTRAGRLPAIAMEYAASVLKD
jgi:hypothetical protein